MPFDSASINQIVREAGISRGSFYMYFDGKEDLLIYLLRDFMDSILQMAHETLRTTRGDLFALPLALYDYVLDHCKDEHSARFLRNVYTFIHTKSSASSPETIIQRLAPHYSPKKLYHIIDQSRLNAETEYDLQDILCILLSVTLNSLALVLLGPQQRDDARAHLANKIKLLRQGLERKLPAHLPEGDSCYA